MILSCDQPINTELETSPLQESSNYTKQFKCFHKIKLVKPVLFNNCILYKTPTVIFTLFGSECDQGKGKRHFVYAKYSVVCVNTL